jgi:galactonate dehydratase
MGPLATAITCTSAPLSPTSRSSSTATRSRPLRQGPLSPEGRLPGAPPRAAGLGVDIDEEVLRRDEYGHWERKLPIRPDGSTGCV